MYLKDLIDVLNAQEDKRFHHVAILMGRVADRYQAGEASEVQLKAQIENVSRLLEIYQIKDTVRHKAMAQMVEDLLILLALKGAGALFGKFGR